jgi:dTDP-4-dehydrorhamnose reductase
LKGLPVRIAVTGHNGQVAQALLETALRTGDAVITLARPMLDLARPASVLPAITAARPDIIVNAAAYTAVDKAEAEPEIAEAVNSQGAGAVAQAARSLGIPVVHLSTDYVFDGFGTRACREEDPVGPVGVYGRTKLSGERAVAAATDDHCILRTAWVYSPFGANFARTMLRLAETRPVLRVVADQYGSPTSAHDIADGVIAVCRNLLARRDAADLRGVFHMTGGGYTHWAGFAAHIFDTAKSLNGPFASVEEITTAEYPTPARRPANSRLDCRKLAEVHGVVLAPWQQASQIVVARLLAPTA